MGFLDPSRSRSGFPQEWRKHLARERQSDVALVLGTLLGARHMEEWKRNEDVSLRHQPASRAQHMDIMRCLDVV